MYVLKKHFSMVSHVENKIEDSLKVRVNCKIFDKFADGQTTRVVKDCGESA